MSDTDASASFIDKWRVRWPEWRVAEVFVPQAQRGPALAWFALRQELLDAAWAGADPAPGTAKLAWWSEELQGWSQGRRRHPLGLALQRMSTQWSQLAASLPALRASCERAADTDQAIAVLQPFADAQSTVAAMLFAGDPPSPSSAIAAIDLVAEQLLMRGDVAVPLRILARLGEAVPEHAAARIWAGELLQLWPTHPASTPARIHAALLRERLRRHADGKAAAPLPRWRVLWTAWRAARG